MFYQRFIRAIRSFILLLFLSAIHIAKANPVDQDAARAVGAKFLHANALLKSANPAHLDLASTYRTTRGEAAFYIFNSDQGFVIVSADDLAIPILGYSNEGIFTGDDIPVQMEAYLQSFIKQMQYGIDHHLSADATIARQWELVRSTGDITEEKDNDRVGPLLTDIWSQDCYYNELCPSDPNGQCGHVYTGCVATSFAQILHYWGFPERGTASHTYKPQGYPQQTADFGATTYQWDNMPDSLSASSTPEQINAVATLMWHCGVAVDMNYGPNGSGSYTQKVAPALVHYFNYSQELSYEESYQYSTEDWLTLIKNNIKMGYPVLYSGYDENSLSGHAFVCDGYDDNNYLHFNWGWGGYYNNYFVYGALNPGTLAFNLGNGAIVNIHPSEAFEVNISANLSNGGTVSFGEKDDSAIYYEGRTCTVIAMPHSGYGFTCWTENDSVVSTMANYSFTVTDNRNLVAHFIEGLCTITLSEDSIVGGSTAFNDNNARSVLFYDFDNGTKMGWTSIDADGDGFQWNSSTGLWPYFTWNPNFNEMGHNDSYGFVCSGSYAYYDIPLTPDNYLVSPVKGKYNSISFYACAHDYTWPDQHFGVAVSTTEPDASDFTTIQEWTLTAKDSGNKTQGRWHQYTVDLKDYSGQDIWVAIRHFNCTDQFFLDIDDITLTTGCSASYLIGTPCTITAKPNKGYQFVNWTNNGNVVSSDNLYTFEVTEDAVYEAHFTIQPPTIYTIYIDADPQEGGVVTGGGPYIYGETANVKVDPIENYRFIGWFENGTMVSLSYSYYFKVKEDRHLTARLVIDNAIDEQNAIKIETYPNPVIDQLHLDYSPDLKPIKIELYDLQGRLICTQVNNLESIDMRNLPAGTYTINMTLDNGKTYSDKIVKQ